MFWVFWVLCIKFYAKRKAIYVQINEFKCQLKCTTGWNNPLSVVVLPFALFTCLSSKGFPMTQLFLCILRFQGSLVFQFFSHSVAMDFYPFFYSRFIHFSLVGFSILCGSMPKTNNPQVILFLRVATPKQ